MATAFTAREQLVRARLAGVTPDEFARLRLVLDAARLSTESRLAAVEAERGALLERKRQLDQALGHFARPDALQTLRSALQKGERLRFADAAPPVPAKKVPGGSAPGG